MVSKEKSETPKNTGKTGKSFKMLKQAFYIVLIYVLVNFLRAFYNFRRDAPNFGLTTRNLVDAIYMALAGLAHIVNFIKKKNFFYFFSLF